MLFKSFLFYQITKLPQNLTAESAQNALTTEQAPLTANSLEQLKWMSPFGYGHPELVHTIGNHLLICAERTQKLLPASIINQAVKEETSIIANQEGRQVSRREIAAIREKIYGQMISKALLKKSQIMAYIDIKNKRLIIGTTNKTLADMFLDLLFKTFSELCVAKPETILPSGIAMTGWLKNNTLPQAFSFANDCEVVDLEEKQSKLKFKGLDLLDKEILSHLTPSRQVAKLALLFNDKLQFVLNQDLSISALKYLDLIQEDRAQMTTETQAAELDADFAIASEAINALIDELVSALGGINQTKTTLEQNQMAERVEA